MKLYCCIILLLLSWTSYAKPALADDFSLWLQLFKDEARSQGVSEATLENAFQNVVVNPRIIALDRKQPEKRKTFQEYYTGAITASRVAKGQELYKKHQKLLTEIGARYGVPPRFIVSLWGIETSFGANTGNIKLVDSLATLAFDGRRGEFFRGELLQTLMILDQGHFTADSLRGSWAGATGQTQFMPSSYHRFAVDYNNDGFADIWNSLPDIFASIANYLSATGWDSTTTWGRKVRLPQQFDHKLAGLEQVMPLTFWEKKGIVSADGSKIPALALPASLIILDDNGHEAYLVYSNYNTILKWNRSKYFATTVGLLADKIRY